MKLTRRSLSHVSRLLSRAALLACLVAGCVCYAGAENVRKPLSVTTTATGLRVILYYEPVYRVDGVQIIAVTVVARGYDLHVACLGRYHDFRFILRDSAGRTIAPRVMRAAADDQPTYNIKSPWICSQLLFGTYFISLDRLFPGVATGTYFLTVTLKDRAGELPVVQLPTVTIRVSASEGATFFEVPLP